MTRFWIGMGLLLVLLAGGVALWLEAAPFHSELARDLDRAAELALEGSWEQARALAVSARDRWLPLQGAFSAITDHEPVERMHALFREISLMGQEQTVDFIAACVHLAETARAIGETQTLKWWGIL